MTTADPNLSEFEGYITATYQDPEGYNIQGAVSIPLIENELGLRIAGLLDNRETGLENITHVGRDLFITGTDQYLVKMHATRGSSAMRLPRSY